jgi:hypothetical protein
MALRQVCALTHFSTHVFHLMYDVSQSVEVIRVRELLKKKGKRPTKILIFCTGVEL